MNKLQYKTTKTQLDNLKKAYKDRNARIADLTGNPKFILELQLKALESEIQILECTLSRYRKDFE